MKRIELVDHVPQDHGEDVKCVGHRLPNAKVSEIRSVVDRLTGFPAESVNAIVEIAVCGRWRWCMGFVDRVLLGKGYDLWENKRKAGGCERNCFF